MSLLLSHQLRIILLTLLISATTRAANPVLQLTMNTNPTVTISGDIGSTYRVEFRTNLHPNTIWQSLGQITLSQSSETIVDQSAALDFERYYRSVAIPSASGLQIGESYSFVTVSAGITNNQTVVVSSPQSGWLIGPSDGSPNSGIQQVSLSFESFGPVSSRITAIIPGNGFASQGSTNQFVMIFNTEGAGAFEQRVFGSPSSTIGTFFRNRALVGQDIAPAQLQANESYTFNWSDGAAMTGQDLIIVNDAQNGILIQSNDPAAMGLQSVNLSYQKLSPVCALLEAVRPADPNLAIMARTNTYLIVFSDSQGGQFQRTGSDFTTRLGAFVRDTSAVGQDIALPQLDPGESYDFTTISAGITNRQSLVISSAQSGWLIQPGGATPNSGIRQVSLSYQHLGPISSRITAVIPSADGGATPAQTNSFLLLFDSTNGGRAELQNPAFPASSGISTFFRNRALVGQDIAPAQLTAGELYSLTSISGSTTNRLLIAVSSQQSGWLAQLDNQPPANGFQQLSLEFMKLGSIAGRIKTILPGDGVTQSRTNDFLLIYNATNRGLYEQRDGMTVSLGEFQRDVSYSNP